MMAETIRYTLTGKEDINFGTGTFEITLADGRTVVLNQVDVGAILNDATLSTQALTLVSLITTSFIRYRDSNGTVLHAFGSDT